MKYEYYYMMKGCNLQSVRVSQVVRTHDGRREGEREKVAHKQVVIISKLERVAENREECCTTLKTRIHLCDRT